MAKTAQLSTSAPLNDAQKTELAAKIEAYRIGAQKIIDDHYQAHLSILAGEVLVTEDAARYVRIWSDRLDWNDSRDHSKGKHVLTYGGKPQRRIHTFIDKLTGDVLKPATYKAPAKHARGNVFDDKNGLGSVNSHGPGYLR